jgi:hypothetical protein
VKHTHRDGGFAQGIFAKKSRVAFNRPSPMPGNAAVLDSRLPQAAGMT